MSAMPQNNLAVVRLLATMPIDIMGVTDFVYYYSQTDPLGISFEGEKEPAYASGLGLGNRVDETMISPSLPGQLN